MEWRLLSQRPAATQPTLAPNEALLQNLNEIATQVGLDGNFVVLERLGN
jgi:hypothetical protein